NASSGEGSEEDIELTDMSPRKDEEALTEEKGLSLTEMREQMIRDFLALSVEEIKGLVLIERKKAFLEKVWDYATNPFEAGWGYIIIPFKKAWSYFNKPTKEAKEALSKKLRHYSIVGGDKGELLLPEDDEERAQKFHALAQVIKRKSLGPFGV